MAVGMCLILDRGDVGSLVSVSVSLDPGDSLCTLSQKNLPEFMVTSKIKTRRERYLRERIFQLIHLSVTPATVPCVPNPS